MKDAGLKMGVPAGYLLWDKVGVTVSDLHACAVDKPIFPGQPRKLGLVTGLADWESKLFRHLDGAGRPVPLWYDKIKNGGVLDETAPMLLRPAFYEAKDALRTGDPPIEVAWPSCSKPWMTDGWRRLQPVSASPTASLKSATPGL
jgi:hypothetical protein